MYILRWEYPEQCSIWQVLGLQKIIAVNNDPKAPIFRYADIGIVADWREYIEQLLKQISVD